MLVTSSHIPSIYDRVHLVTGHPGQLAMSWHRTHSINAGYTQRDAAQSRPVCHTCAYGSMHQTKTDHRRIHREITDIPGQQFVLDAYTHTHRSRSNARFCDLLTDLATGRIYPIFTNDRSAAELCQQMSIFLCCHPSWQNPYEGVARYVRVDPEKNYLSEEFKEILFSFGYKREESPPRDKHANGRAERSVGIIAVKTNIAMLAPRPPVPQLFWDLAMTYACTTHSFNPHSRTGDSPYHYITNRHVDINELHPFWTPVYVFIPLADRDGKVGFPRCWLGRFVGYHSTSIMTRTYRVMEIYASGTYGKVRTCKDVIFDESIDFLNPDPSSMPSEVDFNVDAIAVSTTPDTERHVAFVPTSISTPASLPPALLTAPLPPPLSVPGSSHPVPPSALKGSRLAQTAFPTRTSLARNAKTAGSRLPQIPKVTGVHRISIPNHAHARPEPIVRGDLNDFNALTDFQEEDMVQYWYNYLAPNYEFSLSSIETEHCLLTVTAKEPDVPRTFWQAIKDPVWAEAINKERKKFEANCCLAEVPDTGQHLVPMMWLFNIKTDGTKKARLVGRGDMMIPWVDFDPNAVYCGNVAASSIKLALIIAAMYKLVMRGGDLVGAYLVTLANPDYPVHIKTPQGYSIQQGCVMQAVGNLYGFPPAGQNFSKQFDKCLRESGYDNTPWDPKFFYKWIKGLPIIVIAHSDDFRWFGPPEYLSEWDDLVATFNKYKYEVTDATNKEFVGIHIYHDEDFNYYMDQTRMITAIVAEANMTGAPDAKLPYPTDGPALSKEDSATEEQKAACSKYPYRKVVGQLMYGMVHTMVSIMYALNVLSRYGNNPGPRHIEFLKHLVRYAKHSKDDRLKFHTHDGPTDIDTMTPLMQLRFQCDADLGGNLDNKHSQTSYLGYFAGSLFCWNSTDQGSVSTSTAESEIKAVNHTLKAEVIANRNMLTMMGWKQATTVIEEDNSACVAASQVTHITRGMRHLDLAQHYLKEKVADGSCIIVKVKSEDNNSDIGTKRVPLPLFNQLTYRLVDKSLRKNL